ncbi:MAG: AAA family ATPase, partial [Pirellulaceae bacterium]
MAVAASPRRLNTSPDLAALRAIDFDWTMHLRSVWTDPPYDSAEIHTGLRDEFQERLDDLNEEANPNSPLGWLLVGAAGSGKTHWLSVCRRHAVGRGVGFILVDMTDVRDFWSTVLQGYLDSLQQEYEPGKFQQQSLLEKFLGLFKFDVPVERALELLPEFPRDRLAEKISAMVGVIRRRHPAEAAKHQDVIRAVLATTSNDPAASAAGLNWLNANPMDDDMRRLLGFAKPQEEPRRIVTALSWMMSLCGPTVLAFDQLDPIVAQLDPAAQADSRELKPEGLRALSIIQEIANGLGALRDATYRTLAVVSCLETTLHALRRYTLQSWQDRFEEARFFASLSSSETAASLLFPRVEAGCRTAGFKPPYPTWPVAPQALRQVQGQSPRELLKVCEAHRRRCLSAGVVEELTSLAPIPPGGGTSDLPTDARIDEQFSKFRRAADVDGILEQSTEDERFAPLLIAGCRCLLRELNLPNHLDGVVDDFPGGKTTKPLHARIRIIDHAANDREEHFCFRALERSHAIAFQSRLKGVMNGSGIDQRLPFRHCVVLRSQPTPGGDVTQRLVSQYETSGGKWLRPDAEAIRTLYALQELTAANPLGLEDWLQQRRPASGLRLFQQVANSLSMNPSIESARSSGPATPSPSPAPGPLEKRPSAATSLTPEKTANSSETAFSGDLAPSREVVPSREPAPSTDPVPSLSRKIPLGLRQIGAKSDTVYLPLPLLEKHTVVLAGAGSGKTVLLKRIIEEAALAGVPSIVIDGANDLASLSDRWPEPPVAWGPGDAEKAEAYHAAVDVVHWTPGREGGNPLAFEPLPDLAAVATDADELQMAIAAAVEALASMVLTGQSASNENKRGVLSKALRYFAEQGAGDLSAFIALLSDLPAEAGLGITNEVKLAKDMADRLLAKIETCPMLRGIGSGLDPAVLFGDSVRLKPGPRISVISLIGLPSADQRQQFVYQLGMTLFSWIKRNPHPPGRSLRGLLVVDEARDFIPSQKSIPSKVSLQLLASQARKYHLGLVLATQTPKEIENR